MLPILIEVVEEVIVEVSGTSEGSDKHVCSQFVNMSVPSLCEPETAV